VSTDRETAFKLLKSLLEGQRGKIPLYIAMILEKSSRLRNSKEHYRGIIPSELQEITLDPETSEEIVRTICAEVSQNPDAALLSAISTTGAPRVTRLATELLIRPPRQLATAELQQILGIIQSYLPSQLSEMPDILAQDAVDGLKRVLLGLCDSPDFVVRRHARGVLEVLKSPR
jgi:hypothetical protein